MNNETKNSVNSPEDDAAGRAAVPFFARFLEGQSAEPVPATTNMTLKYPSDRDEIDFVSGPERPA